VELPPISTLAPLVGLIQIYGTDPLLFLEILANYAQLLSESEGLSIYLRGLLNRDER
jgi:hypothetical protein